MGSTILAIILLSKHLVSISSLNIVEIYLCLLRATVTVVVIIEIMQGKTQKSFRYLRASGPLTAVLLGTTFVKIFHPSSIAVVGQIAHYIF